MTKTRAVLGGWHCELSQSSSLNEQRKGIMVRDPRKAGPHIVRDTGMLTGFLLKRNMLTHSDPVGRKLNT